MSTQDRSWRTLPAAEQRTWLLADGLALAALAALLVVAFMPTYGVGWLWLCVFGGTLLGAVIGWFSTIRAWDAARTLLLMIGAWFIFGGLLAMPDSQIGYLIPSLRSLRGLATGPITAWRDMLTIAPPLGTTWNLMTVPLFVSMLAAVLAVTISLRSRRPSLAWLPYAGAGLVAFALGVNATWLPLWFALGLGTVVLLWSSYRQGHQRAQLVASQGGGRWSGVLTGALVLALAGGLTAAALPVLEPSHERAVLRRLVEQPLDLRVYPSPMQGFRANITQHKDDTLFTVSGAPDGAVIRLATLDRYDGMSYQVSASGTDPAGGYKRIGARVDDPTPGAQYRVSVTIGSLDGVWVPTIGNTRQISFSGPRKTTLGDDFFYNIATGTGLDPAGLHRDDSYQLVLVQASRPSDASISVASAGTLKQPHDYEVPDKLRSLSESWAQGAGTAGAIALALEAKLKQGYFSHGTDNEVPSLPGHSYARLTSLLANTDQMVGDEEQYATAMALMAIERGIPARVIYGYRVPTNGNGPVKGADVGAWPQLFFNELGWVTFDPTPPHERVLNQQTPPKPPPVRPHIDVPPPPPQPQPNLPKDTNLPADPAQPPQQPNKIDWKQIGTYTAVFGLPLICLLGPVVLILGLKRRRRRQRQHDPSFANRVAGGWAELLDRARDLGAAPSPAATRSEQAVVLSNQFGKLDEHADSMLLARQADASVFSPDPLGPEQASGYWNSVSQAVGGLNASVPWQRRLRGALSTRSFRRYR